jgi:hypothetical protein
MEMCALTSYPSSAVRPKAAAFSRRRTIIYWVVTLPILAETAAGIQWDLARNDYVKEIFDEIRFPYYFLTTRLSPFIALLRPMLPGPPGFLWRWAGGADLLDIRQR